MLHLPHDKIQRFKLQSLEKVSALEYIEMEIYADREMVEPSWTSLTHSAWLLNVGSTSKKSGEVFE